MSILISWLISAATLWLTATVLPGFEIKNPKGALVVAAVLGVLNLVLGKLIWFLLGIVTLGIGFIFGFATQVLVMALLLQLTDSLLDSLKLKNFTNALIGGLFLTVVTSITSKLL